MQVTLYDSMLCIGIPYVLQIKGKTGCWTTIIENHNSTQFQTGNNCLLVKYEEFVIWLTDSEDAFQLRFYVFMFFPNI